MAAIALMGAASGAWAQNDEVENNRRAAIGVDNTGDVVGAGTNAVENGAATGAGNALGEDADHNAQADQSSTAAALDVTGIEATAIGDSTAVENGAFVGGDGAALGNEADNNAVVGGSGVALSSEDDDGIDEGSAVQVGEGNGVASTDDGASANNNSVALNADENDIADDGSSVVVGDGNTTASAEEGGASVAGDGLAIGVNDVEIYEEDVTAAFGSNNKIAAAHLDEVVTADVELGDEGNLGVDGIIANEVGGLIAYGHGATVTTGNIEGNSTGPMRGANAYLGNTGLANQGDAIGIAANTKSF